MNIIEKGLNEIRAYEKNPRKNDSAVEAVANSIKEFGFKVPIIIDKDGVIVCGHTRWKASKKLGLKTVPCIIADDLTDEQIKAFRLADNKVSELAEWDINALDGELAEVFDIDMAQFGFDEFSSDDGFTDDFSLNDGDKSEICQMTFTLHEKQKELVEDALRKVGDDETFGNTNKNGNALFAVCKQWLN